MITALLLAAGASRRFGGPKLIQDVNGKPLIRWSAETLVGAPVDEVRVVVAPQHDAIRQALVGLNVLFVVNPNAEAGMGESIAAGVATLTAQTQAVLIALGDEPLVDRSTVQRTVERYHAGDGASVVVPTYHGEPGHPVLFDRSAFSELARLTGDRGARLVIESDPTRVALVELNRDKPTDVDTPEALRLIRQTAQFMASPNTNRP